jgi:hypothetical protein
VLKQAAIVAAIAAAGLVSVSPLAFATGADDDHGNVKQVNVDEGDDSSGGLVNISDNNAQVPFQVCNNHVPINVLGIQVPFDDNDLGPVTAALGIFGNAEVGDSETNSGKSCEQENINDSQANSND